ncbi:MAG: DNA polymerase I [Bacteroidetes bacterium]|jgi:DNA polymerase I|nr:DNA polymerase I [Bacteroidota bacterium]MBT6685376.1 DNA polymerase I [Bacteroidota bacterium]MBT7145044.1 DNA polymerase I [Bacteroidota bacterium]MBT7492729.1 DNA polymerase I [Bacteroidota bacterium]
MSGIMKNKLFLLDAYALIYQSYYAFIKNPIRNSKGLNTSATFGFTNILQEILTKEKPTHIAVAFDHSSLTFRSEIFSEYKANRPPTPEDIKLSIPYIKGIIEAYNISLIEVPGFEADDIVGTIAKVADNENIEVFMMTPDKDYAQLVTENVFMYKPRRSGKESEILGVEQIREKFQVSEPKQVIDILALWGDSSDNIPGAPGIGEKGAKKLISEFASLEGLYENLDKLKPKQKETLQNFEKQIKMSKVLATIDTNVPIDCKLEDLKMKNANNEKLKEIFSELEFRTFLNRLNTTEKSEPKLDILPEKKEQYTQGNLFANTIEAEEIQVSESLKNINSVEHKYFISDTDEKIDNLISELQNLKEFCFDTETTSLNTQNAELIGISFCFENHKAYYVPFPTDQNQSKLLLLKFKNLFENARISKIGQNIKYDISVLKNYDIEVDGNLFDTMIAHYLIESDFRHNLNFLSEKYLHYSPVQIEELIGKRGKNQKNMRQVPVEIVKEYACEDADLTFQLKKILDADLEKSNAKKLFHDIEMPLIYVLASMEDYGVKLDSDALKNFSKELILQIDKIEKVIHHLSESQFNISSPRELGKILFDKLKINTKAKKTKTGQYSTSEDVLLKLRDKHPIVDKVMEFRSLKKLHSTYVEALPKLVNKKTQKIHCSFNQAVAATGRLSSNNPNLQNIPIKDENGREIRRAFIPTSENYTFFSADYSQIELRLMAHMSNDESLVEAFNKQEDIHASTASKIYKIELDEVDRTQRNMAKVANFGIIYGISAFGLASQLNISRKESKQLIDSYFESYPGVKKYMEMSIRKVRSKGYSETIFDRRRILSDINSRNGIVRGLAERNAINAPIQGTAADIIKIAMINIYKKFQQKNMKSKMTIQVHDELNFNVYKPELEEVKKIVIAEMENAVQLKVPLIVEYGVGENWLEAH